MSGISDEAISNRMAIARIKRKYYSNEITREEAKELAKPILERVNRRAAVIAKRHAKIHHKITFSSVMRDSYNHGPESHSRFGATDDDVVIISPTKETT